MTITISSPIDGSTIPIPSPGTFTASGQNDTGDDVCGWILDTVTNNAFASDAETLVLDADGIHWDWTLQFTTDNTIALGDIVTVNVYDAVTGGDADSVTVKQASGAAGVVAAAIPTTPAPVPPATIQTAGAVGKTGVQNIPLTVTLQPPKVKCFVFLALLKTTGDPKTASRIVLQQHLPASTQASRTVTFRKIDMDCWSCIHAIAMIEGQKGKLPNTQIVRVK
jgi:hypothetical protein